MVGSGLRLGVGFVNPCHSWLGSWVGVFGLGLWCCPSFAGCLWCSWLGFGVGPLLGRVWFRARFACPPSFPVPVCGVGVRAGPGSRLCPALLGVCFLRFFFLFFCWPSLSRALWSLPTSPFFRAGLLAFFFFCVCLLVSPPLFPVGCCSWLGVAGFGWVVPLCLFGGPVFGALCPGGVAAFCVVGGRFGGCGLFARAPPPSPPCFFFFSGGGGLAVPSFAFPRLPSLCGWCVVWLVPRHSWRRFLCATPRHSWLGFVAGVGRRSPPLLAGVRWRRWCVVCGVWRWCVVWSVPRHSWRRFLCATPRHSWLGFAAGGGGRSPPLLAGVHWRRWCVVCGGGVLVGLWLVCGVVGPSPLLAEVPVCYSPALLAGFRCRCWWAVPVSPGWGPLAAVVCGVWRWCVGDVVAGVWCGWSLATPGGGSCVLLPATPGWVSLPVVVGGPRHSWLGSAGGVGVWCVVCGRGVLVGLWLVCGVVGPSPLLAEVRVCYSPPLLAGFRCRCEAGSDPRGHLWVTWGVYLCAGKPPLADIILSHPPELTRCDSVIGLAIPAMSGHIQNRGTASGDLYIGVSGINRVLLS